MIFLKYAFKRDKSNNIKNNGVTISNVNRPFLKNYIKNMAKMEHLIIKSNYVFFKFIHENT